LTSVGSIGVSKAGAGAVRRGPKGIGSASAAIWAWLRLLATEVG